MKLLLPKFKGAPNRGLLGVQFGSKPDQGGGCGQHIIVKKEKEKEMFRATKKGVDPKLVLLIS
jgi:hypothetical protein